MSVHHGTAVGMVVGMTHGIMEDGIHLGGVILHGITDHGILDGVDSMPAGMVVGMTHGIMVAGMVRHGVGVVIGDLIITIMVGLILHQDITIVMDALHI